MTIESAVNYDKQIFDNPDYSDCELEYRAFLLNRLRQAYEQREQRLYPH